MPEIPFLRNDAGTEGEYPINLYLEPETSCGLPALVGRPGLAQVKDLGAVDAGVRGLTVDYYQDKCHVYWMFNNTLMRAEYNDAGFTSAATATNSVAGYSVNTTRTMLAVGKDHVVCPGHHTAPADDWLVFWDKDDLTTATNENAITGGGAGDTEPDSLICMDTYYLLADKEERRFYVSGANTPGTWDSDNWGEMSAYSDMIRRMISHNRTLYLFGGQTIEFWRNAGTSGGVPFQRVQGTTIQGTGVAYNWEDSVTPVDRDIFFVTSRFQVAQMRGYDMQIVSTPVIDELLKPNTYGAITTAGKGMGVYIGGRMMYLLTVPDENIAVVYDPTNQFWWRWSYSDSSTSAAPAIQCACVTPYGCLVGATGSYTGQTDSILELGSDNTKDADDSTGQSIYRERVLPIMMHENRTAHHRFRLRSKEPNSAIEVTLSHSDDGGDSWTSDGAVDSATGRHEWRRLGAARRRSYKISTTEDSTEHEYYGAYIDASGGVA
jgi:hypothetical protein